MQRNINNVELTAIDDKTSVEPKTQPENKEVSEVKTSAETVYPVLDQKPSVDRKLSKLTAESFQKLPFFNDNAIAKLKEFLAAMATDEERVEFAKTLKSISPFRYKYAQDALLFKVLIESLQTEKSIRYCYNYAAAGSFASDRVHLFHNQIPLFEEYAKKRLFELALDANHVIAEPKKNIKFFKANQSAFHGLFCGKVSSADAYEKFLEDGDKKAVQAKIGELDVKIQSRLSKIR